jgi:hypothetical protein
MSRLRPTPLQLRFGFPVGCIRCGVGRSTSRRRRLEWHHVTYDPEIVTALCRGCHRRITRLNRIRSHVLGRKLTNADRWQVWREFLGLVGQTRP